MASEQYPRTKGSQLTYTIEATRQGSYVIRLGDKILKHGYDADFGHNLGRPSKRLEAKAIARAKLDIEELRGMEEE